RAHRPGVSRARRDDRLLRGRDLQLPDAGGDVQVRELRWFVAPGGADPRSFELTPASRTPLIGWAQEEGLAVDHVGLFYEKRATFLSEVTAALAAAPDIDSLLQLLAKVSIPNLGDWCAVDVPVGTQGRSQRVATAHVDPALSALPQDLQRRYPADP